MSELERRKATLEMVLTSGERNPYGEGEEWNVQDYIESEYGVYLTTEQPLSDEDAINFLFEYYWDEFDKPSPYHLINGKLFKVVEEENLDANYNISAHWVNRGKVEVDCTWYNGGAGFNEMVTEAIEKLEEK